MITRSTDGGTTFALATNGLADVSNASSNFWTPLRRSPAKPDTS